MNRITQLLTALVFCSLVIVTACKKKNNEDPDPLDEQAAKLTSATWGPGTITLDNNQNGDWSQFTLTFQYNDAADEGQYTVSGVPANAGADDVFGTAGTNYGWSFENSNTDIILREDGVRMNVNVDVAASPATLILTFNISDSGSRVAGFDGPWRFELVAQ